MRRGSVWIPVAGTVCLVVIGGMECVTFCQQDVRERLARFVEDHAANVAAERHEAVYGETIDGNAFDDYVAACKLLASQRIWWRNARDDKGAWRNELKQGSRPLDEVARREIAPVLATALESIRRGVRCATVLRESRSADIFMLQTLVDDAIDSAFAAHDPRTLVELFVDRWVLGGHLWGRQTWRPEFRDEWLHALDAESARWFVVTLRRLDERHDCSASPAGYIAQHVREIADLTPLHESYAQGLSAWRWGFDWYWRELVACDLLVGALPELEPPASDWTRRQEQFATFGSVLGDIEDTWASKIPGFAQGEERQLRTNQTRLRLLRLAVAFVHGDGLQSLADPFGSGPIEVEIRGDEATFRSEGTDGKQRLARTVRRH